MTDKPMAQILMIISQVQTLFKLIKLYTLSTTFAMSKHKKKHSKERMRGYGIRE